MPAEQKPGGRGCASSAAWRCATLVLGVAGRADVVEFHGTPPQPVPVEYKRGKPKPHRADEVQLRRPGNLPGGDVRAGRAAWRAVLWRDFAGALMSPSTPRCARSARRGPPSPCHDHSGGHAPAGAHARLPALFPARRMLSRAVATVSANQCSAGCQRRWPSSSCAGCAAQSMSPARMPGCVRTVPISWWMPAAPRSAAFRCICWRAWYASVVPAPRPR